MPGMQGTGKNLATGQRKPLKNAVKPLEYRHHVTGVTPFV
jgi:hypothetical protein